MNNTIHACDSEFIKHLLSEEINIFDDTPIDPFYKTIHIWGKEYKKYEVLSWLFGLMACNKIGITITNEHAKWRERRCWIKQTNNENLISALTSLNILRVEEAKKSRIYFYVNNFYYFINFFEDEKIKKYILNKNTDFFAPLGFYQKYINDEECNLLDLYKDYVKNILGVYFDEGSFVLGQMGLSLNPILNVNFNSIANKEKRRSISNDIKSAVVQQQCHRVILPDREEYIAYSERYNNKLLKYDFVSDKLGEIEKEKAYKYADKNPVDEETRAAFDNFEINFEHLDDYGNFSGTMFDPNILSNLWITAEKYHKELNKLSFFEKLLKLIDDRCFSKDMILVKLSANLSNMEDEMKISKPDNPKLLKSMYFLESRKEIIKKIKDLQA